MSGPVSCSEESGWMDTKIQLCASFEGNDRVRRMLLTPAVREGAK